MNRVFLLLLVVSACLSACTLGTAQEARQGNLSATLTAQPLVTIPATQAVVLTPLVTSLPTIDLVPNDSAICGRLRVDVGSDPGNTLRLRREPDNSATIIVLIPNGTTVERVDGAQDVSADGYNWVNIRYTDPNGVEAVGWAARNAMRDRVTLREEGC